MKLLAVVIVPLVVLAAILGPQFLFTVDETQLAIVTRFGQFQREVLTPGLNVKTPFVDRVIYFDNRLLLFDIQPDSLITEDKRRLVIDVYARGRIVDPLLFFTAVRTEAQARTTVNGIIASELRREIALDLQEEIIRTNREDIMNRVRDAASPRIRELGIQILDVRVKRADFPVEVQESIYARMQAERQRIADRERAEGAERDAEIRAAVDKEATVLIAEAERDANIIRGAGEAEAIKIFAQALEQDPEFYAFQRSLDAYKKFFTPNTTIVLPADNELFQFLQNPQGLPDLGANSSGRASNSLSKLIGVESAVRDFMALRLDIDATEPVLTGLQRMEWDDSSLGCPQSGVFYTQATVSGYSLVFDHNGEQIEVHSNDDGSQITACAS